jgi:hypothetical protein
MSQGENTRLIISNLATFSLGYFLHVLKARGDKRARKEAAETEAKKARQSRIREFKGFMSGFHSWAERSLLETLGHELSSQIHSLRERSAMIKDAFPESRRAQFQEAVENICRMTASNVTECKINYSGAGPRRETVGRNRLLGTIDSLIKIVE